MIDHWTNNIFQIYISVLKRPRFKINIERETTGLNSYKVNFSYNDDTFTLGMLGTSHTLYISCVDSSYKSNFSYWKEFKRSKMEPVRKNALILIKKVQNKNMYEIMEQ